jgi:hypothetical protein
MSLVPLDDVEQSVQLSVATPLQPNRTSELYGSQGQIFGVNKLLKVIGIARCMDRLFIYSRPDKCSHHAAANLTNRGYRIAAVEGGAQRP